MSATVPRAETHHAPLWLVLVVAALAVAVIVLGGVAYRLSRGVPSDGQAAANLARVNAARARLKTVDGGVESRLQLAYAYQQAGDYGRARQEYGRVLVLDPKNTAAEYNLGVIDDTTGATKSAATHYRAVLAIDPGHVLAAKQLSVIEYANQDWTGLLSTLMPAVEANPDMSDLHFLLGVAYEKTQQPRKAIAEYKAALKYYPNMREARNALARLQ